jgi:hypothetical protein
MESYETKGRRHFGEAQQQVCVQGEARRGGRVVLHCVRGELNRPPALAQHLSSSSGGVDADNVTIQSQPGQAVFSLGAANDRTLEKCSLLALQRVLDATITFSDLALELGTFGLR